MIREHGNHSFRRKDLPFLYGAGIWTSFRTLGERRAAAGVALHIARQLPREGVVRSVRFIDGSISHLLRISGFSITLHESEHAMVAVRIRDLGPSIPDDTPPDDGGEPSHGIVRSNLIIEDTDGQPRAHHPYRRCHRQKRAILALYARRSARLLKASWHNFYCATCRIAERTHLADFLKKHAGCEDKHAVTVR